jgi:hypothetical protein
MLTAAVLVGDPLAIFAEVVEVEHRGHRIYPNSIDVVLFEPEDGVGHQKVAHLVAAVVKHQGAPLLVLALAGVGVLVEVGAIKEG